MRVLSPTASRAVLAAFSSVWIMMGSSNVLASEVTGAVGAGDWDLGSVRDESRSNYNICVVD